MNLDNIRIATPCSASWAGMEGDERKRFCGQCKLHVHSLSGMTRSQAEALLAGGKVCVRLYRRSDGTILTKDCPVGVRAAMRRWVGGFAAGMVVLLGAMVWGFRDGDRFNWGKLANVQPFKAIAGLVRWAEPDPQGTPMMGDVMPPPPPRGWK